MYEELVVKRGMSIEEVANSVDIALNRLPYMEGLFEIAKREAVRMQEKRNYISMDKISLRKELIELEVEKRRRELAFLPIIILIMETEKILQRKHLLCILTVDDPLPYRIGNLDYLT